MTLAASVNQGRLLPKGAAYNRMFFMGVTGLTLTVTVSKNGAAFGAMAGTVAEISVGWYKAALTSGDTDTEGDLAFHATDGGANIEDWCDQVAAPVKLADGVSHGGTTATLRLGSGTSTPALYVTNSAGTPFKCESTGGDGHGAHFQGKGQGDGFMVSADSDGDIGFGNGLHCMGGGAIGDGIKTEVFGDLANGMSLNATYGDGLAIYGGTCGIRLRAVGDALNQVTEGALLLDASGALGGPALAATAVNGHGFQIAAGGTGNHDISLVGSGDIQGTMTGTVLANVKKVNDVTVTGTGASGNEWGP